MKNILSLLFFLHAVAVFPQQEKINQIVSSDSARIVEIFKDIHANPELGFMETRTAAIVEKELKALGYNTISGIGITGLVGILENGKGPVVMYRADMDCNAVKEVTGLPYASTKVVKRNDGTETPVMHACGHDAHTTWLIGVAKLMARLKDEWKGTLVLLAQPAEEPVLGAEAMVSDGLYDRGVPRPDYLFGMHTAPLPLGTVAAAKGLRMAGTDQLDITFKGIGGHGSNPQVLKDPIVMAATAIMQYQAIVSRAIAPQKAAVLTVGAVQAGSDNNVIPSTALVKVNLRWFDEQDRNTLIEGIKRINQGIALANGLPEGLYPTLTMKGWAYPLDNSEQLTDVVVKGIKKLVPEEHIIREDRLPPIMASEDFHHLVMHNDKKEYCYVNVGIAHPDTYAKALQEGKSQPFSYHQGDYLVDIAAIPFGVKVAANALLSIFKEL